MDTMKKKKINYKKIIKICSIFLFLLAVVIGYFGINRHNYVSSDSNIVDDINDCLSNNDFSGSYPHKVFQTLAKNGYNLENIDDKYSEYHIIYNDIDNSIALLDNNYDLFYGSSANDSYHNWLLVNSYDEINRIINSGKKFSFYLKNNYSDSNKTLDFNVPVSLDEGNYSGYQEINYDLKDFDGNLIIHTFSYDTVINIDAPKASGIYHYGNARCVDIKEISDSSYHEYGIVGRLLANEGHVIAENGSEIFSLMNVNNKANIEVNYDAKVHFNYPENIKVNNNGVVNGVVDDCGDEGHDLGKFVVANKVYLVCKTCGHNVVYDDASNKLITNTFVDAAIGDVLKYTTTNGGLSITNVSFEVSKSLGGIVDADYDKNTGVASFTTNDFDGATFDYAKGLNKVVVSEEKNEEETDPEKDKKVSTSKKVTTVTDEKTKSDNTTNKKTCTHTWDSGKVVKESTFDSLGQIVYTCTKCGETKYESIEKKKGAVTGDGNKYDSIENAFLYAPYDGSEYVVQLKQNMTLDVSSFALKINNGQNIVLDLNGYTLKGICSQSNRNDFIVNYGIFTIKDSSDKKNDGSGTGRIIYSSSDNIANLYESNVIDNHKSLIIDTGVLENSSKGSSACVVKNSDNASFTMNNGQLLQSYVGDNTVSNDGIALRIIGTNSIEDNELLANNIIVNGGTIIGNRAIQLELPSYLEKNVSRNNIDIYRATVKSNSKAISRNFALSIFAFDNSASASLKHTNINLHNGYYGGKILFSGGNNDGISENVIINGGFYSDRIVCQLKGTDSNYQIQGGYFNTDLDLINMEISGGTFLYCVDTETDYTWSFGDLDSAINYAKGLNKYVENNEGYLSSGYSDNIIINRDLLKVSATYRENINYLKKYEDNINEGCNINIDNDNNMFTVEQIGE